ncbi:polyamine aminopropyltransferase [Parasphingopyxis sp. CP4]|uniref:polyamine aminopropyltransferase n=1 Tax=Parasphingopyxis sp. CP4 TaxID=2724527 RepID=UPI0015A2A343|nr:polyamine aminopropyltransferase [Parasphingopyxis sp. CP4]QLC22036.1 polyamine aminopropyltransferase [Parasphingopyxis sp. CP4]
MADSAASSRRAGPLAYALIASVFVVAICGLVYQLLASTIASYLLGDSVTQFSTIIGVYLFAMGIGSWFSRYVKKDELRLFIRAEILIALIGGWAAAILFMLFPVVDEFRIGLYALVLIIGFLVGLEIPLLMQILRDDFDFRETVSTVLTFDYVGALAASLLFPLILMPFIGMIRTGFMFGLLNVLVAIALIAIQPKGRRLPAEMLAGVAVAASLVIGLVGAERFQRLAETASLDEPIIHATSTPFQRIVLTRRGDNVSLFLNGNLQFSSLDEYRYHEALVLPNLGRVENPRNVLVLGGGDGLAAREVLRHPDVERVTLVDLDPAMTQLFRETPLLARINEGSLSDPRMTVINADGFRWVREDDGQYDAIVIDFPDPTDFSLGKLYTTTFYRALRNRLAPGGMVSVQSGSPFVAPGAFWTVAATLEEAGFEIRPYHAYVPSFGDWGFILASPMGVAEEADILPGGRFVTAESEPALFDFPPDMAPVAAQPNRLDNQLLVRTFASEWRRYDG